MYDEKHETVIQETNVGELSEDAVKAIVQIVIETNKKLDSRYQKFILCEAWEKRYCPDGDDYYLSFDFGEEFKAGFKKIK
jgi:hypothetical protein